MTVRQQQGNKRRNNALRHRMAERLREPIAGTIGSGLGQRFASGCEHEHAGAQRAPWTFDDEVRSIAPHGVDPARMVHDRARVTHRAEQGIENGAGAVGRRKQLARRFALQLHAEFFEERNCRLDVKAAQNVADRRPRRARIRAIIDHIVRDVAASSACDEDLRAECSRAVQQHDGRAGCEPPRADRGHETRSAGADDDNVSAIRGHERVRRPPVPLQVPSTARSS